MKGFLAAICGLQAARNQVDKEEFKNDCEKFSNAAEAIDEMLKTTLEERENLLKLKAEFENVLRTVALE